MLLGLAFVTVDVVSGTGWAGLQKLGWVTCPEQQLGEKSCHYKRRSKELGDTHHVVARKELLEEFSFLVHHSFYDEFIIAGDIEERATGTRV